MDLMNWLIGVLEERGWSQAELARRASISQAQVSHVINGQRRAGADFCIAVAGALREEPSYVLKLAGYLPPGYNPNRDIVTRLMEAAAALPDEDLKEILAIAHLKRDRTRNGPASAVPKSSGAG